MIKVNLALPLKELNALYLEAKTAYYEDAVPIMSDAEFDKLEDFLLANDLGFTKVVGAPVKTVKVRAQLPIPMFSLDKVKVDSVTPWLATRQLKEAILMDKLDGASVELVYKSKKIAKAYTRGDGIEGGDISYLIPFMKIPKTVDAKADVIVRVEALFSKKAFKKWEGNGPDQFKSDRNAVSGLLNKQFGQPALKDVDFVVLQVLDPAVKMEDGLVWAKEQGFDVVDYKVCGMHELNADVLSATLANRKATSPYRCDGIVIAYNEVNELPKDDNPDWAVAFKENDDLADAPRTKVVDILWEVSSHGYLIPKAEVEPTEFDGATVRFCSVKNARWMIANKVGIGAEIALVRSGDIIPCIIGVTKPAKTISQPDAKVHGAYKMNAGGVDYVLTNPEKNPAYQVKRLLRTFQTLEVDFMGEGNIQRMFDAGINTVEAIITATAADFAKADGIQAKGAKKLYDAIHKVIDNGVPLPMLMDASGEFPRGMGTRRAEMIGAVHDLATLIKKSEEAIIEAVMEVPQFQLKTAEMFAAGVPGFNAWMKKVKIPVAAPVVAKKKKVVTGALTGVKVTFTGYRDAEQEKAVEDNGGEVISFGSKTTVLLFKAGGKTSSKIEKAMAKGIKAMAWDQFAKEFGV